MGVDCDLITDKGRFPLGRLYVFDEVFEKKREYSAAEGLGIINREIERIQHRLYWLCIAKYHIATASKFVIQPERELE